MEEPLDPDEIAAAAWATQRELGLGSARLGPIEHVVRVMDRPSLSCSSCPKITPPPATVIAAFRAADTLVINLIYNRRRDPRIKSAAPLRRT